MQRQAPSSYEEFVRLLEGMNVGQTVRYDKSERYWNDLEKKDRPTWLRYHGVPDNAGTVRIRRES